MSFRFLSLSLSLWCMGVVCVNGLWPQSLKAACAGPGQYVCHRVYRCEVVKTNDLWQSLLPVLIARHLPAFLYSSPPPPPHPQPPRQAPRDRFAFYAVFLTRAGQHFSLRGVGPVGGGGGGYSCACAEHVFRPRRQWQETHDYWRVRCRYVGNLFKVD